MSRPPRLHVAGGLYHVVLRGNHRQPIFHAHSDRAMLDDLVAQAIARCHARVHAYCWMTNHIHLAVQVAETPLGPLMQRIAGQYARRLQQHVPTTGHLFERRYRAVLVDADAHLLRLTRYIHLNPVRAGLVADPADYPWSGHRAYLGLAEAPWLTTNFVLRVLGADVASARRAYSRLIALGSDPDDAVQFNRGTQRDTSVLAPDRYIEEVRERLRAARDGSRVAAADAAMTLEALIAETAAELGLSAEAMASRSRSRALGRARCVVAERACTRGIASVSAVARRFNRSHSSLFEALERRRREPARSMKRAADEADPAD